ncbi:hypothetical protein HJ588_10710 [Flexivirga sp. ID2601S]|uniref:Aldo/keto reductase n=1 Tax=Flexivirga aerilata TaxID=1656889 RepID=A0A849AKA2_9MICO|nr:hypothetical protein [Flexivirga aerilata]NNG39741.1 hypothetical protein [Flexivirga aerilata]
MTPDQLARAHAIHPLGDDVVPIPGSRQPQRTIENARAADMVLDRAQLDRMDRLAPPERWAGDRRSFAVPVTART